MEKELLSNLNVYFKDTTKIIISHRLSTILGANNIIVMEDGSISEQGNHSQLVKTGGIYASLFQSQELAREMEIIL